MRENELRLIDDTVEFPLALKWEDSTFQVFHDIGDIQCNLEDFDSDKEPDCRVTDARGRRVTLKVSMTWIEVLQYADAAPRAKCDS